MSPISMTHGEMLLSAALLQAVLVQIIRFVTVGTIMIRKRDCSIYRVDTTTPKLVVLLILTHQKYWLCLV